MRQKYQEYREQLLNSPLSESDMSESVALNLGSFDPRVRESAREAFNEGNAKRFVYLAYETGGTLDVVLENIDALKSAGLYEVALVEGFVGCRSNHAGWSISDIAMLFRAADRTRLLAVGEPLPSGDSFTLYRGVSRRGKQWQVTGLSWTSDFEVACHFALLGSCDPAVYEATIPASDIYCYVVERGEAEFICRPRRPKRCQLTPEEMVAAAQKYRERKKALNKLKLAKRK